MSESCLNLFVPNTPFFYSLKHQKILRFSDVSGGRGRVIGNKLVNLVVASKTYH